MEKEEVVSLAVLGILGVAYAVVAVIDAPEHKGIGLAKRRILNAIDDRRLGKPKYYEVNLSKKGQWTGCIAKERSKD